MKPASNTVNRVVPSCPARAVSRWISAPGSIEDTVAPRLSACPVRGRSVGNDSTARASSRARHTSSAASRASPFNASRCHTEKSPYCNASEGSSGVPPEARAS
ncbi:hypothetical protein KH5H1_58420 [Corallococcus caeni]|nr:hypothetical protein KH5H1_58420 [Corallococcus sp. KH5-1]